VRLMLRDIDYAAVAIKTAIVEKFGRENALDDLEVTAKDQTISVCHGPHVAEGTRDRLITALHKARSYVQFWQISSDSD
jgi:hypothetical protein